MLIKKSLLAAIMLSLSLFSQAKIFEATGVGDTPDAAKKDAVANAIKFSVGEMIVSKEELNNEQMTQKIISYSDGYVKKINVLSNTRLPNGVYETQVKVDIESQLLTGTLKEMNIAVLENAIDNDSLLEAISHFDKKEQNKKTMQDYQTLVEEFLLKPIEERKQVIDIEIVEKLKPLQPKDDSEYFPFEFIASIGGNKDYVNGLKKLLDTNKSEDSLIINEISLFTRPYNDIDEYVNLHTERKAIKTFYLPKEKSEILDKAMSVADQIVLKNSEDYGRIVITLINKDGSEKKLHRNCGDGDGYFSYYYCTNIDKVNVRSIPLTREGIGYILYTKYKVKFKFYLTKDEVLNLKDIKLSY